MPYTNRTFITFWRWTLLFLIVINNVAKEAGAAASEAAVLEAHLSQHSVTGTVTFTQSRPGEPVSIKAELQVAREYKGEYSWGIYEFPIDYTQEDFCHSRLLGRKPILNFDTSLNKLPLDEVLTYIYFYFLSNNTTTSTSYKFKCNLRYHFPLFLTFFC